MTITDEMIEAHARFLCRATVYQGYNNETINGIVEREWRRYAAPARAALTAVAPLIALHEAGKDRT